MRPLLVAAAYFTLVLLCSCVMVGNGHVIEYPLDMYTYDWMSAKPADGSTVKYSELQDGILEVSLKTPRANPMYEGDPATGVQVEIFARGHTYAVDGKYDGWVVKIFDEYSELESVVNAELDMNTAHGQGPVKDEEIVRFSATFTALGGDWEHKEDIDWSITFKRTEVRYCEIRDCLANKGSIYGVCSLVDEDDQDLTSSNWEINCDVPGGCGVIDGSVSSNEAMTDVHVGVYNFSVRADVLGEWTPWYSFPIMVDPDAEAAIVVQRGSEILMIRGTQSYMESIATACCDESRFGTGFNHSGIENVTVDQSYVFEKTLENDGESDLYDFVLCLAEASIASDEEKPLLINYEGAEGKLPEDRLDEVSHFYRSSVTLAFYIGSI